MSHMITYVDRQGRTNTARMSGDLEAIRTNFARDGKVITQVRRDFLAFMQRVKREELISTLKGIGGFIQYGDPLSKAFDLAISSLPEKSLLAGVLTDIKKSVQRGKQLHSAMEPHRQHFGNMAMALVLAGENSGKLGLAFTGAAKHIAKMSEVKVGILKKLWYPVGTIMGAFSLLTVATKFVVPTMNSAGAGQTHAQHSGAVSLLLFLGQVVPWVLLLIIVAVGGIYVWFTQQQAEAEKFLFRLAGLREIVFFRTFYIGYFTLATLVGVGVPLYDALGVAGRSSSLVLFRNELENAQTALRKTGKFASALKSLHPFRRGTLENAMNESALGSEFESIAESYYQQYISKIESIAPKATFLAYVIVGVVILLTVMATIVPNFEDIGNVGNIGNIPK